MAFKISRKKSVKEKFRAVALEQVDKAIDEIYDESLDRHEVVHQVRKRCKKLRGLLRLVRPEFEAYNFENAFFRDAARELAYVRDAQSILDCFDSLIGNFREYIEEEKFAGLRMYLFARRQRIAGDESVLREKLDEFLAKMQDARRRVENWTLDSEGFAALEGGLKKTYRRGRKTMHNAFQDPSTENMHEWRKRVKYHWYHVRLLRSIWPEMMKVHRNFADQLSDLLGDDHDLAILHQTLRQDVEQLGDTSSLQVLFSLIDRRHVELQTQARPVGHLLFSESPGHLISRLHGYWETQG